MGMFDTIRVHRSHLSDDEPTDDWQTKDLDCELVLFELNESGELIKRTELYDGWNTRDCNKPVDYTGVIRFYTGIGVDWDWREYRATFVGGKLIKLESINEQH